jgi:hypothetical protein
VPVAQHDTPPDDEVTGRTRLVNEVERRSYEHDTRLGRLEKLRRRHGWWVQAAWGVLAALAFFVVKAVLFVDSVATKDQLRELQARQLIVETKLDMLIQQSQVTAKAVKAPVISAPQLTAPTLQEAK